MVWLRGSGIAEAVRPPALEAEAVALRELKRARLDDQGEPPSEDEAGLLPVVAEQLVAGARPGLQHHVEQAHPLRAAGRGSGAAW